MQHITIVVYLEEITSAALAFSHVQGLWDLSQTGALLNHFTSVLIMG